MLDESETKQRECLEMQRAIHGHGVNHFPIAAALGNMTNIFNLRGKLDEALSMQRQSLEMERAISGMTCIILQ